MRVGTQRDLRREEVRRAASDKFKGVVLPGVPVRSKSHRGASAATGLREAACHGPICTHLMQLSMNVRYRVTLPTEERQQLELLVRGGTGAVRMIKRAQILLAADAGSTDEAIAHNVGVGTATVYRIKQRFVTEGLERALHESPRPGAPRKLGPGEESLLIAVACSKPPAGRARWTLDCLRARWCG